MILSKALDNLLKCLISHVLSRVQDKHSIIRTLFQFVAVYEYDAADEDEVTIKEGDIIINAEIVAEGWMVGTNSRTGHTGMMPSNYVEPQS